MVATAAAFVEETTMRSSLPKGLLSVKEHHRELRQKVVDCLPQGGIIYMEVLFVLYTFIATTYSELQTTLQPGLMCACVQKTSA